MKRNVRGQAGQALRREQLAESFGGGPTVLQQSGNGNHGRCPNSGLSLLVPPVRISPLPDPSGIDLRALNTHAK